MDNEQLLLAMSNMLDKKLDEKLQPIHNRLDAMENRLDKMENRLDKMENRLDKIESEVSALKAGQIELSKEVKQLKIKVEDTYDLALEAWGRSVENRKWLEAKKATS